MCTTAVTHKVCAAWALTFQQKTTRHNLSQHLCNTCSMTQLHTCLYPQGNSHASTDPSQNLAELQYSFTVYQQKWCRCPTLHVTSSQPASVAVIITAADCLWFACTAELTGGYRKEGRQRILSHKIIHWGGIVFCHTGVLISP